VDPQQLEQNNPKVFGKAQNFRATLSQNLQQKAGDYAGSAGIADSKGYFTKNPGNSNLDNLAYDKDGNPVSTPYVERDSAGNITDLTTPFASQKQIANVNAKKKLSRIPNDPEFFYDSSHNTPTMDYNSFMEQIRLQDVYNAKDDEAKFEVVEDMSNSQKQALSQAIHNKQRTRGLTDKELYLLYTLQA